MSKYEPELGQALFGCPTGHFDVPDYGCALLEWLMKEIGRVFWNREQEEWDRYVDPRIDGIEYRPYYWGEDEAIAALPNFKLTGEPFEIRWYKHSWRGLSCTHNLTPAQWVEWFNRGLALVHTVDEKRRAAQ